MSKYGILPVILLCGLGHSALPAASSKQSAPAPAGVAYHLPDMSTKTYSWWEKPPHFAKPLKTLPVQFKGRLQPFDTFARNSLQFIYGKLHFHRHSALDVVLSWMLIPDYWNKTPFIQLEKAVLKKALKLDTKKHLFSPSELLKNPLFVQEVQELQARRDSKKKLNNYFKGVQKLENRLALYLALQKGEVPGFFPSASGVWLALAGQLQTENNLHIKNPAGPSGFKKFQQMMGAYVKLVSGWTKNVPVEESRGYYQNLEMQTRTFHHYVEQQSPVYKNKKSKLKWEVHFNQLHPFRWAWVCYMLGLIVLFFGYTGGVSFARVVDKLKPVAVFILFCGFGLHGYGMALRSFIMSRPPVSNMYETVLWVPWAAMVLGAGIWWFQKFSFIGVAATLAGLICLCLADYAPYSLLNDRLEPLQAVLNSNFWLSTHVLVITMSYGAFLLAFLLGDMCLYLFLKKDQHKELIKKYVKAIYRSIQTGVVLLAFGTVLGGIWADYSWGRFWGWDPKEVWALVSLLGYLALLHAKLKGRVQEFGTVVGAILNFFLIVMAWYGVNYVLGKGLHSYGFGSGGVEFVLSFALLHILYVLGIWAWRKS